MTQLTGQPESVLTLEQSPARPERRGLVSDLSVLTKPRITAMVAITAWIGYEMGAVKQAAQSLVIAPQTLTPELGHGLILAGTIIGTSLSCMGASALNQVIERRTDALMQRTKNRPIPAGRMSAGMVTAMGSLLSLLGVSLLALFAGPLAAVVSAITIASYAFIYTPMKRVSSACTIVGAVPGALPPVIGYAAATGTLAVEAWVMFAILFLWQLPHFLAIAWLYKDDYARAGLPMLPVVDPDGSATSRQILLGCMALLPLGLLPTAVGMSGRLYFAGALLAGLVFLVFGIALARKQNRRNARALFFASLIYLPLVFALMVIDKTSY